MIFEAPTVTLHEKTFVDSNIGIVYCQAGGLEFRCKHKKRECMRDRLPYYIDTNSIVANPRSFSFKIEKACMPTVIPNSQRLSATMLEKQEDGSYLFKGLKPEEGIGVRLFVKKDGKR